MTIIRRRFLQLASAAAALPAVSRLAYAETYPARPVHIVVPVPPGGALDITARLIGNWLSQHMGQSFIVDNRPGGGTNIGVEVVAHANADGYTLLLMPQSVTINPGLYKSLPFNFIRDVIPISIQFPVYFRHPEARPLPGDSILQSAPRGSDDV